MIRIARRAGMVVVIEAGDADAHVALAPATPMSFTSEMLADRVALFDFALRSNVEAWRRVGTAFAGVSDRDRRAGRVKPAARRMRAAVARCALLAAAQARPQALP